MALTNEEILDAIASKTVLEISELIKMMEEKFGVTATAAVAVAGPPPVVLLPRPLKKRPNSTLSSRKSVPTRSASSRLSAK